MSEVAEFEAFTHERARLLELIRKGMACDILDGDPCGSDVAAMLPVMADLLRLFGAEVVGAAE